VESGKLKVEKVEVTVESKKFSYYHARTMSETAEPNPVTLPEDNFSELLESIKSPSKPRALRQGLPSEYQMRHDAHYVEELAAQSTHARTALDHPSASFVTVQTSAALRDICQEFEGLASCFNLLDQGARPLRERLGLALARIGVQRGVRYAQQLRVLLEDPHPLRRDLRFDELIRDGFTDLKEELRLTESTLVLDLPGVPLPVRGDGGLLRTAVRACAGAAISLIETNGLPGDIHVSAFASGDSVHCEFRQDAAAIGPQQLLGMFDLEAADRSCRVTAVALNATRRIAQLHGGHFEARRTSTGGCAFVFSVPKTPGGNPPSATN
jgi:signal transduction histidine kinase